MVGERGADLIKGQGMLPPSDANIGIPDHWQESQR
jgi:hypothetical protein